MRFFLPFIFILASVYGSAQVTVEAKATGKHARVIDQAKQAEEQRHKLEEQAGAQKLFREKYDSIKIHQFDSLGRETITTEDSLRISNEILSQTDFPPEYRALILNPIELNPELSSEKTDSIALAEATSILEEQARKFMPDELGNGDDPLTQLGNPADGVDPLQKPGKPNPNLVKPDAARALFKKVDPEQFKEAQADIQKLKKKYSELPDTRYPEEGTKRNSLKDVPFKKRLYFGGNISLQSTDPLILSTNLQLGYWINKKWLGGAGITLREQFTSEDSTSLTTGDGHGYSLFTRYDIPKGFFAWAESEWQIDRSLFDSEQSASTGWQKAYLLGVGREFSIGFVQMTSTILYDFNYQNNDLNPRPFVFRLGVRFSKKPG